MKFKVKKCEWNKGLVIINKQFIEEDRKIINYCVPNSVATKMYKEKKKKLRKSKEILSITIRDFDKPLSELEKFSKPEIRKNKES